MDLDIKHINRYVAYSYMQQADALSSVFNSFRNNHSQFTRQIENKIQESWSPYNSILVNQMRALEHALHQENINNLPEIIEVLDQTHNIVIGEDIDGWTRDERLDYHHIDSKDRTRGNLETILIQKRQNEIDQMSKGISKDLFQKRLDQRQRKNQYEILKVGHYKRLLFAEAVKHAQVAQVVYLQTAGFYYGRWTLSPMHPEGDICDVCARYCWLDHRDQEEYHELTEDTNFGGLVLIADMTQEVALPELEHWSDGRIASAIRQYSRHNKIDERRKRAGLLSPHACCKCMITPILESRV